MITNNTKPVNSTWTDEQWNAISVRGANLLVAAAAGSGKTAVLVERIIQRISDEHDPVDVDRLLVATFTNAAAAEMRQRIREALEQELIRKPDSQFLRRQLALVHRASITTIHSFCLEVVRRYFQLIPLDPGFRIANETEAELLRQEMLEELFEQYYRDSEEDSGFWQLLDSFGGEHSDDEVFRLVLRLYDHARSHPEPALWLEQMGKAFEHSDELSDTQELWLQSVMLNVRLELDGVSSLLQQAISVAMLPQGPAPYLDNLKEEQANVEQWINRTLSNDWNGLYEDFQGFQFGRLKACRGDDYDKALQEKAKGLRDQAKKQIAKLSSTFFQRSLDSYLDDLVTMRPIIQTLVQMVIEFSQMYQTAKKDKGLVDFADLEHYCLMVLRDPSSSQGEFVPSQAALQYREHFAEILLDEYQDTNRVQETILSLIAKPGQGNRFMVGDVKQSIYRFRLAEPELFLQKYRTFSSLKDATKDSSMVEERLSEAMQKESVHKEAMQEVAAGAEAEAEMGVRIDLARNFRSRREVVDAVNFIFRQTMIRDAAEMDYDRQAELVYGANYTSSNEATNDTYAVELMLINKSASIVGNPDGNTGGDVDISPSSQSQAMESEVASSSDSDTDGEDWQQAQTTELEARVIAEQIKRLMGSLDTSEPFMVQDKKTGMRPMTFRDIVILLRSTKQQAPIYMEQLRLAGIPAYAELDSGYFKATELEIMLSLLKVIDNPFQDIPLASVLRSPIVGLGAEQLSLIRIFARQSSSFFTAVEAYSQAEEAEVNSELQQVLLRFLTQLEEWRIQSRQGSLSDLVWNIYRQTGFFEFVGGLPGGAQRQANLRALHDRARQYEATSFRGLFRFLRFIERMQESGGDLGTARALGEQEDVVRIMSIHKSKGLEFPIVFVAGLGKNFNIQDLNGKFLHHKHLGFGPKMVDRELRVQYPSLPNLAIKQKLQMEMLAEELRILYVALTRPREKLYLLGTVKDLQKSLQKWSIFASEEKQKLPAFALTQARCYLDWIGPSVIRHPHAHNLRRIGEIGAIQSDWLDKESSQWRFHVISPPEVEKPSWNASQLEDIRSDMLNTILSLQKIRPETNEEIAQRLSWQYPFGEAEHYFAKTTVSELKRQGEKQAITLSEDSAQSVHIALGHSQADQIQRDRLIQRPRFMEQKGLTAAERGTAYHAVMQHFPLETARTSGMTLEQIVQEQLDSMVDKQLLTTEQKKAIEPAVILDFFRTDLGQKLLRADRVLREVPFSYGLPANRVYSDASDLYQDEKVIVQGVIDCLFEVDGLWVLLDYKTDQVRGNPMKIADQYRLQLNLYAEAIRSIWRQPVDETYIYLFDGSHLMRLT